MIPEMMPYAIVVFALWAGRWLEFVSKLYRINESFYSLQGEGARSGTANVFVRFSGCNLTCSVEQEGFDCDTEFVSGRSLSAQAVAAEAQALLPSEIHSPLREVGVIFTGGEPSLQLDEELLDAFRDLGFDHLCIETNGTTALSPGVLGRLTWISCSPKTAEHTLRLNAVCSELRYVRRAGQGIPRPSLKAGHKYISPAFSSDGLHADDLAWCIELVKENPDWSLSVQQHKNWRVR